MSCIEPTALARLKANSKDTALGVHHGFVDRLFREDAYEELIASFPDPAKFRLVDKASGGGRKRFYVGPEYVNNRNYGSLFHLRGLPQVWKDVLNEFRSEEFMAGLAEATAAPLNSLANFGFTYGEEGCMQEPHLDGAIRPDVHIPMRAVNAMLLYFNKEPDPSSATELYDLDKKTILAKGTTMRNALFYFNQHPDSWHGFPLVHAPHTRRLISLAYSNEVVPLATHYDLFHRLIPLDKWAWAKGARRGVSA